MAKKRVKKQTRVKRRKKSQKGGQFLSAIAGMPKAAWNITKYLETLAAKNAERVHKKREREIRTGKRKSYGGESLWGF